MSRFPVVAIVLSSCQLTERGELGGEEVVLTDVEASQPVVRVAGAPGK
jgi:hypothetical protein